jgi:hypothetical protein
VVALVLEAKALPGRIAPAETRACGFRCSGVNKIDTTEAGFAPFPEKWRGSKVQIVPVSASRGRGLDELLGAFKRHLPEQRRSTPGTSDDRNERFLAANSCAKSCFAFWARLPTAPAWKSRIRGAGRHDAFTPRSW